MDDVRDAQIRCVDNESGFLGKFSNCRCRLEATTDPGLCHGVAGLAHIAARAATDAHPVMTERLRAVIPPLLATVLPRADASEHATALIRAADGGAGLLDGAAGIALALTTVGEQEPPRTEWDSCLLIA